MERIRIDSTLEDLKLHQYIVKSDCSGQSVYETLEKNTLLPGVLLISPDGLYEGMISRRRFLESMSRAYGRELFLRRPMSSLWRFVSREALVLPSNMPVTEAAQQAIARDLDIRYEPIVVECSIDKASQFYLLDIHDVLQAQLTIHQLTSQRLQETMRSEIIQTEKMASLGRTMAGVAHEIRNPVNFILGNLKHISDYTEDLTRLIQAFDKELETPSQGLQKLKKQADLDFILDDFPKVIQSVMKGTDRLRHLVTSLRTFSRMDEVKQHNTDIHESIDSTLIILNSQLKQGIAVHKQYAQDLPAIPCYAGQIGQVFMNIISNAIDALLEYDAVLAAKDGLSQYYESGLCLTETRPWVPSITIITKVYDRLPEDVLQSSIVPSDCSWTSICIRDNGPGIPIDVQAKVFEDFFTTKPINKGTGLGLPISHQIVTDKHKGHLILRSPCFFPDKQGPGRGTEFEILLPMTVSEAVKPISHAASPGPLAKREKQPTLLAR